MQPSPIPCSRSCLAVITIALASNKGGCAKTTTACALATDLALDGLRTCILDCDPNQHAAAFGRRAAVPGFSVVPNVGEETVIEEIRNARSNCDFLILDLPGVASRLTILGIGKSAFVIVPCQQSAPDLRDALRTNHQIDETGDIGSRQIGRALLWTRVPSGFESRVAKQIRADGETRMPTFSTSVMERTAYKEMLLTGVPPRVSAPDSAAAANIQAVKAELLDRLASLDAAVRTEAHV
nr:ParA family protein [Azospirillum sp. A1-3]